MSYGNDSFGVNSYGVNSTEQVGGTSLIIGSNSNQVNQCSSASILSDQPDAISIVSPVAYQLIRRGTNTTVTIPVTVTYTGNPTSIEIRWDGGGWQSFTPSGSPQICNLTGNPRGYGALEARFSNNVAANSSVTPVAVGKAFVGVGQSNMDGRGASNQAAPAAGAYLFDSAGGFHALTDPWAGLPYGGTATYSVLDDGGSSAGSYIPRLAQRYIDAGEPTLWIPAAKGSTSISQWARNLATTSLYGAMKARVDAAGGVDAIIWHQGENEAFGAPNQATYETNLANLVANFASDFGNPVVVVQKIHTMAGYEAGCATIRAAQENVIAAGNNGIKRGADLDGITTAVHFTTSTQLTEVADRTFVAINANFIIASNSQQGNQVDSASVRQTHLVGVASSQQSNILSTGEVSQATTTFVAGSHSTQGNTSSAGSINQCHLVSGGDSTQVNQVTPAAVSMTHRLTAANSQQNNQVSGGGVTQSSSTFVVGSNSTQANQVTPASIRQTHRLIAANSAQANQVTPAAIRQTHLINVANCGQVNLCSAGRVSDGQTTGIRVKFNGTIVDVTAAYSKQGGVYVPVVGHAKQAGVYRQLV